MKVGVISDTHGLLRPEALAALAGVAHIVHAGDIGEPRILERLREIAPVSAVRGNVDTAPWAGELPETLTLELGGCRVHVLHDVAALAIDPADVAAVIFGHSHRPGIRRAGATLMLNPGSAGPRRFALPTSLAFLTLLPGRRAEAAIRPLLD